MISVNKEKKFAEILPTHLAEQKHQEESGL
jgi:hypothetical protein